VDKDHVEFEDGIWVHHVAPSAPKPPVLQDGLSIPQAIWSHADAMLREVERVAARRPVDCAYAPLWDCEGAAILLDGRFALAVELHTPLQTVLATQPHLQSDAAFMSSVAKPIMALEKRMLLGAPGLRSMSSAITTDIERGYGVDLRGRVSLIPAAIEDWSAYSFAAVADLPPDSLRLLFVGRLEPRKGIDLLLEVAGRLLPRFPRVYLDIVGNDTLPGPDGRSYRALFETDPGSAGIRDRVRFHGEVSEDALRGFYRACDVFVAPSRFESFGLILLEAMMFAKPVVCCRTGGMPEVVADGETALLAEPGDAASLERCLERLIEDPALRQRLGTAGRRRYEAQFTPERMASEVAEFLCSVAAAHRLAEPPARRVAAE
jgi:glycogen(starch) synthase